MNSFSEIFSSKSKSLSRLTSVRGLDSRKQIIQTIDKCLSHLNLISQTNTNTQDLYIQLLKQKKSIKYEKICKVYKVLTQGSNFLTKLFCDIAKANEILFQKNKKQLLQTDYKNDQSLVRLCWRSMQKLINKITYYMINQNHLGIISKSVLNLIKFHHNFVKRFKKIKNQSIIFVIQFIQKIIQENLLIEKNIFNLLLNRGYIMSMDQFYRVNGSQAEHAGQFYASKQDQQQKQKQKQNIQFDIKQHKNVIKSPAVQRSRRKKGFLIQKYKYFRRQQSEKPNDTQKNLFNKTNFQIRQNFDKLIQDFLQNAKLNEVLQNHDFESQATIVNSAENQNQQSQFLKNLFQRKIESAVFKIQSKPTKVNSKILQTIEKSSRQVINKKAAQINQVKSEKQPIKSKQIQKKKCIINDRKIINQAFFKQMSKKSMQLTAILHKEIVQNVSQIQVKKVHMSKIGTNTIQRSSKNSPIFYVGNLFQQNDNQQNLQQSLIHKNVYARSKRHLQTYRNFDNGSHNPNKPFIQMSEKIRNMKQNQQITRNNNFLKSIQNVKECNINQRVKTTNSPTLKSNHSNMKQQLFDHPIIQTKFQNINPFKIRSMGRKISKLIHDSRIQRQLIYKFNNSSNSSINQLSQIKQIQKCHNLNLRLKQKLKNSNYRIKTQSFETIKPNVEKKQYKHQNQIFYQVYDTRNRKFCSKK